MSSCSKNVSLKVSSTLPTRFQPFSMIHFTIRCGRVLYCENGKRTPDKPAPAEAPASADAGRSCARSSASPERTEGPLFAIKEEY
ncbi:hypothetical protein AXX17_ATUG04780 [Arabidopsis thaliana]|uniref:Uncharacterized protein n=1 Tax=Arabidopsis thaliana TaxID=3702 RepID=A0A178U5A5_ARATH|nr:hypothetical protein AXX17_ATUG04780 [Arabidopsis thaliana]